MKVKDSNQANPQAKRYLGKTEEAEGAASLNVMQT